MHNSLISADTATKAIKLARDYLTPHAKAAFSFMGADQNQERAKKILKWINKKGKTEFQKRLLHNELQGIFKRVEDLDGPLAILIERNYICEKNTQQDNSKAGRKPSPIFEVNPGIHNI